MPFGAYFPSLRSNTKKQHLPVLGLGAVPSLCALDVMLKTQECTLFRHPGWGRVPQEVRSGNSVGNEQRGLSAQQHRRWCGGRCRTEPSLTSLGGLSSAGSPSSFTFPWPGDAPSPVMEPHSGESLLGMVSVPFLLTLASIVVSGGCFKCCRERHWLAFSVSFLNPVFYYSFFVHG